MQMTNDIQYLFLRSHPLFKELKEDDVNQIVITSEFKRAQKGDIIYASDKEIDSLYLLHQGRVKIAFCLKNNLDIISEILIEDDIFGELTLAKSGNTKGEFAQVISDTAYISTFSILKFQMLLRSKSNVALKYSLLIANKLNTINWKYCLAFKDVRSRVLNYFKLYSYYEGVFTGNKVEIKTHRTHQDIAVFIGSSRQTVSTIINELVKEKIIIYEGRTKVIVPDIKKLDPMNDFFLHFE
jgi:CRP/FNR family cyclic AMP-dependent transcriptional regulator